MSIDSKKPILHFAHANSFPAGTYRQMFAPLSLHYDIRHLDLHAHDPLYPVTDGWDQLAQELIDTLVRSYKEPVILVGHSLGGILCLLAAKARPELVRCVVILDSPVVTGWRAALVHLFKVLGLIKKYSPARFSEKRRQHWASLDEAYRHFVAKEMFAIWPPTVLRDYIDCGTVEHSDGVALRFRREIETAVYMSLPHNLGRVLRGGLSVPVGFVGGTESVECRKGGLEATKRLVGRHFVQIQAGHLLPMEVPEQTAAEVHAMIQALLSET